MRTNAAFLFSLLCFSAAFAGEQPATSELSSGEIQQLLEKGIAAYQNDDIREAIEFLSKIIKNDPDNFDAHCYLVLAFAQSRHTYDYAADHLKKATDLIENEAQKSRVRNLTQRLRQVIELGAQVDKAIRLYRQGKSLDALNAMIAIAQKQPNQLVYLPSDDPSLYVLAARALTATDGNTKQARKAYAQALSLNQDQNEARLGLGLLSIQTGDSQKGLSLFSEMMRTLDLQRSKAHAAAAAGAAINGDSAGSLRNAREFIASGGTDPQPFLIATAVMIANDQREQAEALFSNIPLLRRTAKNSFFALINSIMALNKTQSELMVRKLSLAFAYASVSWDEQALPIWKEISEQFPKNTFALTMLAKTQSSLATNKVALESAMLVYEKALEIDPQYSPALSSLGRLAISLGDTIRAERYYKDLVKLRPDSASAHYFLGYTSRLNGKFDEAIAEYDKAAELDSESIEALLESAKLLMEHKMDYGAAVERARKAKTIAETISTADKAIAADLLGWALLKQGSLLEASKELLTSLELLPRATTHYHVAVLYQESQKPEEAIEHLEKALKLDQSFPESEEAQRLLAQLQDKKEKTNQ